jgi:hypothetical protein
VATIGISVGTTSAFLEYSPEAIGKFPSPGRFYSLKEVYVLEPRKQRFGFRSGVGLTGDFGND